MGSSLSVLLAPSLFSLYGPIVSPATARRSSQKHPPSCRLCIQWPSFHPLSKTNHSVTHFSVSHHFSVRKIMHVSLLWGAEAFHLCVCLVIKKYCWQYKILHINNKRTGRRSRAHSASCNNVWLLQKALLVFGNIVMCDHVKNISQGQRFPAIDHKHEVYNRNYLSSCVWLRCWLSTWFVIKVTYTVNGWILFWLMYAIMPVLLITGTWQKDCQRRQQESKSILRPI